MKKLKEYIEANTSLFMAGLICLIGGAIVSNIFSEYSHAILVLSGYWIRPIESYIESKRKKK